MTPPATRARVGILIGITSSSSTWTVFPPGRPRRCWGVPLRALDDPLHRQVIASVIAAPIVWVAEDAGDLVACCAAVRGGCTSLFVAAERQRQGIGRMLMDRFEDQCGRRAARRSPWPPRPTPCRSTSASASGVDRPAHDDDLRRPGFTTQPMKKRLG
jgi:GNAT superfamily N-acetyltransferase